MSHDGPPTSPTYGAVYHSPASRERFTFEPFDVDGKDDPAPWLRHSDRAWLADSELPAGLEPAETEDTR